MSTWSVLKPLAWIDSWDSDRWVKVSKANGMIVVAGVLVCLTGAGLEWAGMPTVGGWLYWIGSATIYTMLAFVILLAWRSRVRLKRVVADIRQRHKAVGEAALAAIGACRWCSWLAPNDWENPDGAAVAQARKAALLEHEAQCDRRP